MTWTGTVSVSWQNVNSRVWEWSVSLVAEILVTVQFQWVTTIRLLSHTHTHTHTHTHAHTHQVSNTDNCVTDALTSNVMDTAKFQCVWVKSYASRCFSSSMLPYVHRYCKTIRDEEPRASTSFLSHSSRALHLDECMGWKEVIIRAQFSTSGAHTCITDHSYFVYTITWKIRIIKTQDGKTEITFFKFKQ